MEKKKDSRSYKMAKFLKSLNRFSQRTKSGEDCFVLKAGLLLAEMELTGQKEGEEKKTDDIEFVQDSLQLMS